MIALWDFRSKPWTWDFFTWVVMVRESGATGVDFRLRDAVSTKWPMAESIKRFWNYLAPGPRELADMAVSIDGAGVETQIGYNMKDMPSSFRRLELRQLQKDSAAAYTVTIRDTFHRPLRNSDQAPWREFARRIGAKVIEDSRVQKISLRDRFTLYANARMNYGVPNGPFSTLWYTPYTMCMFSDPANENSNKSWGGHLIKPGDRMPWLFDNQHLIWQRPTLDALLKAHEAFGC